jgi:hypothetical protein
MISLPIVFSFTLRKGQAAEICVKKSNILSVRGIQFLRL